MRIPNAEHESRPWRIRKIVPDFTLEDVWELPVQGNAEDFQTLIEMSASETDDLIDAMPLPARALWRIRDRLGGWIGLGRISVPIERGRDDAASTLPIPGTNQPTLADRLPDDLRDTAADLHFASVPFTPLYRTDVEFAAEMSNRTVHSVMHLAWVDQGARAATKDRWPSTSSPAVCSGGPTWRSSSRSDTGSSTRRSWERWHACGRDAFPKPYLASRQAANRRGRLQKTAGIGAPRRYSGVRKTCHSDGRRNLGAQGTAFRQSRDSSLRSE
jgi:hypothetical protein